MSQIQVTAAQLKTKADDLSAQNTQLQTQINLLKELEQSLNAMWEGDANTAFHSAFQRDMEQLTNFYNAIKNYVTVLTNVAAKYEKTESQNVDIATKRNY